MKKLLLILVVSVLALSLMPVAAQDSPFAGQKVVVVTQEGSAIGGPAEKYGAEWAAKTGATVEVQRFAFGDLYPKIITALQTGTGEFDVMIYASAWMGDIAGGGYVLPVPDAVKEAIDWNDVLPLYRERIADWGGTTYAVPFDGDSHMMYYRKDLVNPNSMYAAEFQEKYGFALDEPQTWSQYKAMAEFFQGREVDTAGVTAPIYGVAEALRKNAQSYWFLMSRTGGYAKVPGDPFFFFDENMTPLVNTPGWVQGLQDWIDIYNCCAAPDMINFDVVNVRALFPAGQTVFGLDWGDVGPITVDPNSSVVQGLAGFGVLPGAERYWDRATSAWVDAEGGVNKAPFIAFGGWVISVAADSDVADAAFDYVTYLSGKDLAGVLATTGGTGVNPLRQSQFDNLDLWINAGFDEESAKDYLAAVLDTINDPNNIVDLRIPGASEYFNALDQGIAKAITGELDPQAALDEVAAAWDAITERLGRDSQLQRYKESLGIE
ncbi:MAG: extracellular solute-binding protein [Anaerolineae bacterium]|nr:extracellular solute-binding protein [Anaerolineae bacterium]